MASRLSKIVGHLQAAQPVATENKVGYRFTSDAGGLPDALRKQYEENGFFVVKKLVSEQELARWTSRFLDISTGRSKPAKGTLVMRDVTLAKSGEKQAMGEEKITKLQDWQNDEVLFEYCQHPKVLQYVKGVIGPNVKSVHTMLINKPPDLGGGSSRHPPHQDLWYFPFRPADRIVASWTAMQKIDLVNGCLFVKPGSHKGELLRHEYPDDGIVNKAYHGIQNMSSEAEGKKMHHLLMEPGDTVFFHPLLIHGSGRNNSKGYRKAISCHYASTDCHYEDANGTVQEDIAKELEEMARMKGKDFSWQQIFRAKSRLVAGKEGTL